jgi:hypothetical protein
MTPDPTMSQTALPSSPNHRSPEPGQRRFGDLPYGAIFFDPMSGEDLRKTGPLTAMFISGGDYFEGVLSDFAAADPVQCTDPGDGVGLGTPPARSGGHRARDLGVAGSAKADPRFQWAYQRSPLYCNLDQRYRDLAGCAFFDDLAGELDAPESLHSGSTTNPCYLAFIPRVSEDAGLASVCDEVIDEVLRETAHVSKRG